MSALLAALWLAAAPPPGADDPVLQAMDAEVKRAMTLKMSGADKPYYARAYVVSEENVSGWASFGALFPFSGGRQLKLATAIRVGTPALDNTNFQGELGFGGLGHGADPAEEDVDAIRRALWLAFDGDYKKAVEQIARKKAWLQANQVKDLVPDWGPARAEQVVLAEEPMPAIDGDAWGARVKKASMGCRAFKSPQACVVAFRLKRGCQRFVASDGARHRFCETSFELTVSAQGQGPDGMPVGSEWKQLARTEAELPTDEQLVNQVKQTLTLLEQKLAAAAPKEDYAGPVLFTSEAAPAFFLSSLAAPLAQPREPLGGREQGRLIERLGKHIAVSQLTAVDDPTRASWTSPSGVTTPLFGYYPVDDDGVRPQPITLVKEGVLQTLFMSRIPTRSVPLTNGHARGDQGAVGNLFISTSQPTPLAQLKKRLVELAKEEDSDFGLMVLKLPPNAERSTGAQLQLPNLPLLVYRVYADGREELVRGYAFKPATFRVLKDIVGLGDDPTLLNTELRGQSVSAVAPSVLVKVLELARPRDDFSKPPALARPLVPAK